MPADAAGEVQLPGARSRVHGDGLLDDEAIRDELADGLACDGDELIRFDSVMLGSSV